VAVLEMSRSAPACNLFSLPGDSTMNAQYALTHFVNDDGYLRWLAQNPNGFVVNSNRVPVSSYLILHRASANGSTPLTAPTGRPPATSRPVPTT